MKVQGWIENIIDTGDTKNSIQKPDEVKNAYEAHYINHAGKFFQPRMILGDHCRVGLFYRVQWPRKCLHCHLYLKITYENKMKVSFWKIVLHY